MRDADGKRLRAIDLLCGAGGWGCAARGLPVEITLAVDRWDAACRTHRLNHPNTAIIKGDVREAKTRRQILRQAVGVEVILGAIPCEWLSMRRLMKHNAVGPEERDRERATLQAVLAIIKALRPSYWCVEDVTRLKTELPPDVPWFEIDSKHFSGQRRRRLYVGHFPMPTLRSCPHKMAAYLRPGPHRIGRRAADRNIAYSQSFSPDKVFGARPGRKSPCVVSWASRRDAELVIEDPEVAGGRRQIEWQEGAALQGFPADYVFYGSPTDVWKMIGQAVQIDTGRAILEGIVADAKCGAQ